jgi:His-Xaa-Ser system protein HxsD
MESFFSKNIDNNRLELFVDSSIFPVDVILRSAYTFIDKTYFFFSMTSHWVLVQIQPKEDQVWGAEKFALEYSDELLATLLRYKLENDNKEIRETIVKRALGSFLDEKNFVSVDTAQIGKNSENFDKDIDSILAEIENDPNLKIDETEIDRILLEIQTETDFTHKPKTLKIDPNKLNDVKKNFQNR